MGVQGYVEDIKNAVPLSRAIETYCSDKPIRNRIPCPIHSGKDRNFWFNDQFYYCFVCKESGDIVSLTQHIFGLSFPAALDKLNTDFGCGAILDRRPTLREQRAAQARHAKIMEERQRAEAEKQARQDLYNALWDEWCRLDRNRMEYAPQSTSDEFHPLFVEALQKISYQEYLIDTLL